MILATESKYVSLTVFISIFERYNVFLYEHVTQGLHSADYQKVKNTMRSIMDLLNNNILISGIFSKITNHL